MEHFATRALLAPHAPRPLLARRARITLDVFRCFLLLTTTPPPAHPCASLPSNFFSFRARASPSLSLCASLPSTPVLPRSLRLPIRCNPTLLVFLPLTSVFLLHVAHPVLRPCRPASFLACFCPHECPHLPILRCATFLSYTLLLARHIQATPHAFSLTHELLSSARTYLNGMLPFACQILFVT